MNITENGKEIVESAGKKSVQYYEVTFNVLPRRIGSDGRVKATCGDTLRKTGSFGSVFLILEAYSHRSKSPAKLPDRSPVRERIFENDTSRFIPHIPSDKVQ